MNLREIMSRNLFTVAPKTSITEAAKLMRDHNVGAVPVVEGKKIVGILTDRDLAIRGLTEGKEPGSLMVSDIMSREMVFGHPEMDVHEAAELMANEQVRRLPVVESGALVGMVALGDLAVEAPYENEAGSALGEISQPSRPLM